MILSGGCFSTALAQEVPQGAGAQRFSMVGERDTPEGKKPDFLITGITATNVGGKNVIQQFEMKSFHNGNPKQVQIIAQAPQCEIDQSFTRASDKGPVHIFTPTTNQSTNLYVQGVGFLFTQSNHFLTISNQVETWVVKSLLKTSLLSAPRTNAAPDASRIYISALHGEFNFDSNVVDYGGSVHMVDPQLDMTCDLLTIRFTTNGTVESILARQNVVLTTTNNGRATGATGFYYVTNGNEMMELTTDAKWRNDDQAADAQDFIYDPTRHILTGIGHVRAQWPNAGRNPTGGATNGPIVTAATNGFRELYADFATLRFPPTNGPVESMHARGHVIIINEADQSRAMADEADYQRTTDSVELTGNPVWWNNDMEVKGEILTAELGDKTYHARTNAHFKMRTGSGATNHPAPASGHATNQWLFISSDDMEYQTNQAIFYRNVETRLVENDVLRDKLNCTLLTINLISNKVESAVAFGNVRGETARDVSGVIKTIACQQLNAYLSVTTGLVKTIDAYTNVIIEENGTASGAPRNKLAADTVTAQFSAVTNQIEKAVADQNVVFDQFKGGRTLHATSRHGVYTAATDQVKLTGTPLAHTESDAITGADYMVWQPKSNRFQASGLYKIVPIKLAASQK